MNSVLSVPNLVAWSLQIALVILAGSVIRLRLPKAMLVWRQALLAACLLLPLVQPWRIVEVGSGSSEIVFGGPVAEAPRAVPRHPAGEIAWIVLAAGIATRLVWLAAGCLRLRAIRRAAEPCGAPLPEVETRAGATARWYFSDRIDGPLTFGVRRPVILLPGRVRSMPRDRQEAVCAHELLHVRRYDWALTLAEEAVRTLLWFHPAIWWLVSRIRLNREQVVDRAVVELTGGARRPYLDALLDIAGAPDTAALSPAPSFLKRRHLKERVALILKEIPMSKKKLVLAGLAAVACALTAGAAAVRVFPLHTSVDALPALAGTAALAAPPAAPVAAQGGPYSVKDDGVTPPAIEYKVEPRYSPEAKANGVEGTVVLEVVVGADGVPGEITVKKSLDEGLDRNAEEAVRQWRFKPGQKDGVAVPVKATIEINYRLMDSKKPRAESNSAPDVRFRAGTDQKGTEGAPVAQNNALQERKATSAPALLYKVEPQYTEEARSAKIEGSVLLSVQVNPEGRAENITVVRGIDPGLDRNAVDAIGKWQFRPAMKDGQPVTHKATIEVNYRLQ